LTTAKPGK